MNECRTEESRLVAITFGCTFLVTTTLSILLTSVVICLYLKLWQHKGNSASKSKSASPHPELADVESDESEKDIAAVNTGAEPVVVSLSQGDAQTD